MNQWKAHTERQFTKLFEKSDRVTKQEHIATRDNSDKNHNQTRQMAKDSEKRLRQDFQKESRKLLQAQRESTKAMQKLEAAVHTFSAQKDMTSRPSYVDQVTPCKTIGGGGTNVVDDASAGTKTTATGLSDVTNSFATPAKREDFDVKRLESEKEDLRQRLGTYLRPKKDPSSAVPTEQKVPAREEHHIANHHDRMQEGRRRKAREDASKL